MMRYAGGGMIPGKEIVKGNSPLNDTKTINVSPGEMQIIIDKNTISKGPMAMKQFALDQIDKNHPNAYKEGFDDGGAAVNPNYQGLQNYFNPNAGQPMGASAGQNAVTPADQRIRELEAVKQNIPGSFTPAMQQEYFKLKAGQGQSFYKGGVVSQGFSDGGSSSNKIDFQSAGPSIDFQPIQSSSKADMAQTALENFGNAVTLGYLPQLQAAGQPIVDKAVGAITGADPDPQSYVQSRDENIARIAKESEENPKSALAGKAAGLISGAALAPELPFLKGGGWAKAAGRGAVYGAGYGAAQNPGDKPGEISPLQAEDRAENAAYGIPTGGAFGLGGNLLGKGINALRKNPGASTEPLTKNSIDSFQDQLANANSEVSANGKASISGGGGESTLEGRLFNYNAPKNLDELNQWSPPAGAGALPGKQRLEEIENIVPDLQIKPMEYHYDMMENPKAMKDLKIQFENLPTDSAKKIAAYNQGIVDESADKIQKTVNDMTGQEPKSISDSGNDLIAKAKDKYDAEKESLGPVFKQLQQSAPLTQAESRDLALNIGENSKIGQLMKVDPETGDISLAPNKPRTGLSDQEHSAISRVIDDLNQGMTFKEMQASREFLRKQVDPANPGATPEINNVRSIMLGQLENMADKRGDDVGSAFKAYAVNERARENVEKIIGGSINDLDKMYAANPENVVKKIFANPNYAKVVGDYVGHEKMQEMTQSYIQNGIKKSFDPATGFNPVSMRNWLKTNGQFLSSNVDPDVVKRLSALADYGYFGKRFLDEANPSGTAASLKAMLEPGNFYSSVKQHGIVGALEATVAGKAQAMTQQRQAIKAVNEAFGTPQKPSLTEGAAEILSKAPGEVLQKSSTQAATNDYKSSGGYQKWYADGLQNLKDHAESASDKQMIDSMRSKLVADPRGQQLLLEASTSKPGSQKMNQLLSKIKDMK